MQGFIYQVTEAVNLRCFENRIFINFLNFSRRQVFHYNFNECGHWHVCFPQSLPKVCELLVRAFKKEWNLWIALEFMGVFIVLMKLSLLNFNTRKFLKQSYGNLLLHPANINYYASDCLIGTRLGTRFLFYF